MSIAVVIPTYNSGAYLDSCLASVTAQTRQPDEVWIVDDRSTDGTAERAEAWAKRQPFAARVIPNRFPAEAGITPGPAGGRQTGLLTAKADFVALLDHDDEMLPRHLELTGQALAEHPDVALCFGDAELFGDDANQQQTGSTMLAGKKLWDLAYREAPGGLRILTEGVVLSMTSGSYIPTASNLWRRSVAIKAGGFQPRAGTCDDTLFFWSLSRLGAVAYYPFAIARKRAHTGNLSAEGHQLDLCWNYYDMLHLFLAGAERWQLSTEEVQALRLRIQDLESEVLYHASRKGLSVYFQTRKRLVQPPPNRFAMLRALLKSAQAALSLRPQA